MKHHPDKNPDKPEASAEKFKQVCHAEKHHGADAVMTCACATVVPVRRGICL